MNITTSSLICIIIGFIIAIGGYNVAKNKGRNSTIWFFNCIFIGILALIIIALIPKLEDKKEDSWGIVVFIPAIIIFIVQLLIGLSNIIY